MRRQAESAVFPYLFNNIRLWEISMSNRTIQYPPIARLPNRKNDATINSCKSFLP